MAARLPFARFEERLFCGTCGLHYRDPFGYALAIATPNKDSIPFGAPIIALLEGSRFSVSGPTAAFIIILFPVIQQYGTQGLGLATFMAGGLLVCMSIAKLDRLIEFIP